VEINGAPGARMMALAQELWPINRSITGRGNRQTLMVIKKLLPDLRIETVPSGYEAYDWKVPDEWFVKEAYIIDPEGERFCDFSQNNLHLVGYSEAFEGEVTREQLNEHLHSLPSQPEAVPYVTSYYHRQWGFCISHQDRVSLRPGTYRVVVRTEHFKGRLDYGELLIPGRSRREVVFSTYICHPSMANNELSGPVLATEIASSLSQTNPYYSYRFVFLPETIGALVYLSKNLAALKKNTLAGYVLTCVGDNRCFSYVPSRLGNTVADKSALKVLGQMGIDFKRYLWKDRGSDERQFCSPGADLPFCSVMRSKYGEFPEYHTSLDTLGEVVSEEGLSGSREFYQLLVSELENNRFPSAVHVGEPQLSRRNLYPKTSVKGVYGKTAALVDFLSWSDGSHSVSEIADLCDISIEEAELFAEKLLHLKLISL